MAGEHVNELHQLYFAGRHGFLVNSNDGFYQRGKSYGMETKLFVAAKYLDHKEIVFFWRGSFKLLVAFGAAALSFSLASAQTKLGYRISTS